MKIFIINLPTQSTRRKCSAKQLTAAGMSFDFFDALKAHNGWSDFFEHYDERQFLINTGRTATQGEIGCYASHLALWKHCVQCDEPIMIMEDDFLLKPDFSRAFQFTEQLISEYGFIRLQYEQRGKRKLVKKIGTFDLVYYTKMPHSLMCYAITPTVARAFINASSHLTAPVDVMIKKIWEHKQRLYGLMPYPVVEHELGVETNIRGRVKLQKRLPVRFERLVTKITWIIKRYRFTRNFTPPT